jgi:predicted DNA binding CopG/RHH family protein
MSVRKKSVKTIPQFRSEDEERSFWARHDTVDYFDFEQAAPVSFPHLRPTTQAISVRLPVSMLEELKRQANQRDVPYQSLLKVYLSDQLARERKRTPA